MEDKIIWHLEKRKLKDLRDFHKNPRKLSDDQWVHLRTSLDKFGLIDRPCINLDGTIIGGHQRIKAIAYLGEEEVEVMVPSRSLDKQEIEELNIRLNRSADWDFDILANQYEFEDLVSYGFDPEELLGKSFAVQIETEEEDKKIHDLDDRCPECNQKIKKKYSRQK